MCVCNVFWFVYRSVEHAFSVVTFRLSKVADHIFLDLLKKYIFWTFVSLVNSQIASVCTGLNQLN